MSTSSSSSSSIKRKRDENKEEEIDKRIKQQECLICLEEIKNSIQLGGCTHEFCYLCIIKYVRHKLTNKLKVLFPCPICRVPFFYVQHIGKKELINYVQIFYSQIKYRFYHDAVYATLIGAEPDFLDKKTLNDNKMIISRSPKAIDFLLRNGLFQMNEDTINNVLNIIMGPPEYIPLVTVDIQIPSYRPSLQLYLANHNNTPIDILTTAGRTVAEQDVKHAVISHADMVIWKTHAMYLHEGNNPIAWWITNELGLNIESIPSAQILIPYLYDITFAARHYVATYMGKNNVNFNGYHSGTGRLTNSTSTSNSDGTIILTKDSDLMQLYRPLERLLIPHSRIRTSLFLHRLFCLCIYSVYNTTI